VTGGHRRSADETGRRHERQPPVIVVTPEGSLGEDPGAPVTVVTGAGSPGIEVAVPSEAEEDDAGDEDPADEDPGASPLSGMAGAGPPVMVVIAPSDWLQAAVPPSGAAASSSKAAMIGPARGHAPPHAELRPDVPHRTPSIIPTDRPKPPGDRPFDQPAGSVFKTTLTIYLALIFVPLL